MTSETVEFLARPRGDSFQFGHEFLINRIVGSVERLKRPLARGEQDREQGDVLLCGSHTVALPTYAASGTARARARAAWNES